MLFVMVFGFVTIDALYFAIRYLADPIYTEKSKSVPRVRAPVSETLEFFCVKIQTKDSDIKWITHYDNTFTG